jgi:DNA repair exonuclease SbcCD ATPase subunit
VTISELNPSNLEKEIETIVESGKGLKKDMDEFEVKIKDIGEVSFDEDRHHTLTKDLSTQTSAKAVKDAEITRLELVIDDLVAGGICQSCNRKLDDVDNSEHINGHKKQIVITQDEVSNITSVIESINKELDELNTVKEVIDNKNKLELSRDRLSVEIGALRNDVSGKMNELKKYKLNAEAIELNKRIDSEVENVKTQLVVENKTKDDTITNIERVSQDIKSNKTSIETKTKLIETIKKEEEIEKIFKMYIELVGKKGISKLVLRSVLPIINSEVQRLLEDVCDFEIEIFMNDKNDVEFLIIKDEIPRLLKSGSGFEKTASSLALRGVLGKISTLPMPNFITFDEVLGKVAAENIEKLKPLFDKIKDMYDIVFLITHNDIVKDCGTNVVTVVKENNISKINLI